MRCGEDHEVGCGPCGRAVQAEPLVVNPGNTAWRFGHCTFKTPTVEEVEATGGVMEATVEEG